MNPIEKLIHACQLGDVEAAILSISDGADVNASDGDYSAIHWAAQEGHIAIVGILLDNGANVNSHDMHGASPLHKATGENNPTLIRYLLERGADVNNQSNDQGTPLHTACAYGLFECANILLAAGANMNIKDANGKVPVDYAEMYNHTKVERFLQEKSSQPVAAPDRGPLGRSR